MNWREKIITAWPNDLQKSHRCRTALQDLDRVLLELSGLGHPLHVEEGYQPPPAPGWPKPMFHLTEAAKAIWCQGELDELGDGWYPTMEEARNAHGLQKQWERGGIFGKTMPQLLSQTPQQIKLAQEAEIAKREAQRKFVEDMRTKNRPGFHGQIVLNEAALHNDPGPDIPEREEHISGRR